MQIFLRAFSHSIYIIVEIKLNIRNDFPKKEKYQINLVFLLDNFLSARGPSSEDFTTRLRFWRDPDL